ncbi:MAG: hypothetical protein MJ215_06745 [Spirochaetia bacterium]|nr:hypothetical protein [Spirochaetia bacterium]
MTGRRPPLKILFTGILSFLVGLSFLLKKVYGAEFINIFVPVLLLLSGVFALYLSVGRRGMARYFISGVFLLLLGAFLVCSDIIYPNAESPLWPIFMFIFGLVLVIYAAGRRNKDIHILIPAAAICILAVIFMPFSFKLFTTSLFNFVMEWWPVLCILAGAVVVIIYFVIFSRRMKRRDC